MGVFLYKKTPTKDRGLKLRIDSDTDNRSARTDPDPKDLPLHRTSKGKMFTGEYPVRLLSFPVLKTDRLVEIIADCRQVPMFVGRKLEKVLGVLLSEMLFVERSSPHLYDEENRK